MTTRYYLSPFMKAVLIFGTVMVLLSTVIFYFVNKYTAVEFPGGIIPFAVMDILFIAVIVWRMKTPVVEISDAGITVGIPFLFKKNTARWDEIEGMTINEIRNLGIKERQVKILVKSEGLSTREVAFSLRAIEKPDEIVETLSAKIPEKRYEDIKKSAVLQKPIEQKEITYRGWTATERGLTSKRDFILWDMIREIKYPALVIGGYGAILVIYVGSSGKKQNITIKPSASEKYLTFLRYLIQRAQKATIDPGLVKALDYSPKDARADLTSAFLFITGVIELILISTLIFYYSTGISTGYLNTLLLIPFGMVPLALTIRGLAGRFRGETTVKSKRMLWPLFSIIGPLMAVLLFFVTSPFSFYWFSGDIARKTGNLTLAEQYYQASLKRVPDNIDVLYEMGKLNRKKENYEQALSYLKQAYTKDPTYWGPQAVILVPDTLMKMHRYDEALKWCEQILKDRPNKIDIARAISKKQDEIISEKSYYERQNNSKETDLAAVNQLSTQETPLVAPQIPKPVGAPEKEAALTEPQNEQPKAGAQTPFMFPQSSPSRRCGLAPSSGIVRFLTGNYTGNKTIDLIINIVFYIYFCLCLFFIARKLQITAPWAAWIPIVNLWTLANSAGKPWWWILLFIIPLANIFIWIHLWMCISENTGRNRWLGLLMLIPFVSFVFMGMLALSGKEKMSDSLPA